MTYTKGPWGVGLETDENDGHGQVIASDGEHLAVVSMYPIVANTRLIAAAPELLEACKQMMLAYAFNADKTVAKEGENVLHPAVKYTRAAIAKAEGRQ